MSAVQQALLAGGRSGAALMATLTTAGLTTNLKLCLDAGDAASYDPGVQTDKWLDRSGGGYDFFRGSGTGGDAADPTFTGAAGYLPSYWNFDGGDYFTYNTTNETWMQNLHKNNAVFTVVAFYRQAGANEFNVFGDVTGASVTGMRVGVSNVGKPTFGVWNATANVTNKTADTGMSTTLDHMVGLSLNEATGAGGGFFYSDGAYNQVAAANTFDSTYTSPAAGNATATLNVAALGSGDACLASGDRLYCVAIWQGTALTKANMDTIWAAMRGRFGI